jgi:hypothetical protein
MARNHKHAEPDLEIRCSDGKIMTIEVKGRAGSAVSVRDLVTRAAMRVSGASAASVGAASVFGWYVRSAAPWSDHADSVALRADWQTIGDDIWRAAGQTARGRHEVDARQSRLFDPADFSEPRR